MIVGKRVELIPAKLTDRQNVYEWCFQSETTKAHSGPPNYSEKTIATYDEFCKDYYEEYYFTDSKPKNGRGYLIVNKEIPVGFISYSCFHLNEGIAELDIWMNSEGNCGRGFGTEALVLLGEYLHRNVEISTLLIAPSVQNKRAIRSYEKAGFEHTEKAMTDFLQEEYMTLYGNGDYGEAETAIMVKTWIDK